MFWVVGTLNPNHHVTFDVLARTQVSPDILSLGEFHPFLPIMTTWHVSLCTHIKTSLFVHFAALACPDTAREGGREEGEREDLLIFNDNDALRGENS